MRILLDANVLLRIGEPGHPQYDAATTAAALLAMTHELVTVPQSFYEYWVVATRPKSANGRGLTPAVAHADLVAFRRLYPSIPDPDTLLDRWLALVVAHNVRGKPAHDARLAAAMLEHGVSHLLTFNTTDFARFPVNAVDPADVAAGRVVL